MLFWLYTLVVTWIGHSDLSTPLFQTTVVVGLVIGVAAYARKSGVAHAAVHLDLRRACGGPELATATSEEVAARIDRLRRWLVGRR